MMVLESPKPMTEAPQKISFADLRRYADRLGKKTGFYFGPKRFGTVRGVLLKRMKDLGHSCLDDYIAYVEDPANAGEWKTAADLMVSGGDA